MAKKIPVIVRYNKIVNDAALEATEHMNAFLEKKNMSATEKFLIKNRAIGVMMMHHWSGLAGNLIKK